MPTQWEPELEPHEGAARLWMMGYFHGGAPGEELAAAAVKDWDEDELDMALDLFQEAYHVPLKATAEAQGTDWEPTGTPDIITEQLLMQPRCSFPDTLEAAQWRYGIDPMQARWPDDCKDEITLALMFDAIKGLHASQTSRAFKAAAASWNEVLDLMITWRPDLERGAKVYAEKARLNNGVLGQAYLAQDSCGSNLQMIINSAVDWSYQYLLAVVAHELGHILGLRHLKTERALMYPYARLSVFDPKPEDIAAALLLGYKEIGSGPGPDPEPGPLDSIVRTEVVYKSGRRKYFSPSESSGGTVFN